ncbi:DUF5977 domain-containing protein [Chryseobacterium flavum]|uniref:DUF5977 domain-containing protein n=1 Tax=Chryseobacterium flavum TaxID=415851 RepID=UPI002FD898DC
MKKYNSRGILLPALFAFANYQSQITTIEKQIQNIATPEIASIMKYADFPELNYIGKTNISVPIYDIKFGKLNIPIGLSYNTKGNKVADIATSVGLGWNLNATGNLTVKVNDMNDLIESYSYYTTATFEPELSLAWHRQSKGYLNIESPVVDNLCINNRIWENDDIYIDSTPDFYYVNAPGLTDKFYFTRINDTTLRAHFLGSKAKLNNTPNLTTKTSCKSLEGFLGYGGSATVFYQIDKFEITGENGYIYTYDKPESSIINDYASNYYSHNSLQVNNWNLTKIKDPFSGKEVIFEYEYYSNPYEHLTLRTDGYLNFGNYPVANNFELGKRTTNDNANMPINRLTGSVLIPTRLKKIITSEVVVELLYGHSRLDYPGNALTNIQIKNKNASIIKQVNFSYDYFDSANCTSGNYECKRLKLNSITDSSLGTYKFYYDSNNFPARNSSKVDFLGYYNNNDSDIVFSKTNFHEFDNFYPDTKIYFYPTLQTDQLLPFPLIHTGAYATTNGVDRSAKPLSKLGLLKKLVYPAGGSLELSYENDDFIYDGEKHILGSTRVNNMRLFDSNNVLKKEINYKYINENNTSSGEINFVTTPSNIGKTEIASGIGFNTGAIIGYSRIIEEEVGKGYIERKYSNFSNYPDKFMQSDYQFTDQPTLNFLKFLKFPSSYVQSFDDRRGKLISESFYKEGVTLPIKRSSYEYDYQVKDSLKVQKTFTSYNGNYYSGTYKASNHVVTYFNNLKKKTEENFFSSTSIKLENSYNYDDARLKYRKTISADDITEEYYRNAKDKNIQKLIDANILDRPVEIEKKYNGKTLAKQETKYDNSANLLPTSELSYDLKTMLMRTDMTYDRYDSKGNLLQYTEKSGIPTTVIWGYRQSQPIAKVENANYSQVMQAFGLNGDDNNAYLNLEIVKKSDLHFDSITEADLISKLKEFSKKIELKDCIISTYTHAPLIGVKSMTSASGHRESYKYDLANRLEKIEDSENKTIKEYKYNYAPAIFYNNERRQVFTRTNCGPGTLPEPTTYVVPIGKYSSTISQADADQKAQTDVNTNGQAYANSNGVCTPYVCTITPAYNVSIYYSSFQETSANHINAILSLPVTDPNLNWSGGVFIGTLQNLCTPNSYKNISAYSEGTSATISIAPNGGVTVWLSGGGNNGGSVTFNFEYDK